MSTFIDFKESKVEKTWTEVSKVEETWTDFEESKVVEKELIKKEMISEIKKLLITLKMKKPRDLTSANPERYNKLIKLITNLKDQFLNEISSANFEFDGFDEGSIYFAPTYKFDENGSYTANRIPAWCDRIIYKHKNISDVLLYRYNSIPTVKVSDHKPVYAIFKLNTSEQVESKVDLPQNTGSLACNIF